MADTSFGPRSRANARALLDAAESLGLHPGVIRTQVGGYLVPEEVAAIVLGVSEIEEGVNYDAPPAETTEVPEVPKTVETVEVEAPKRPAVNEPKDVWVTYATATGLSVPEDATKAEVIDLVKSAEAEEGTD